MPGTTPNPVRLFRITHRDNLRHILQYGICNKNHRDANAAFVPIGNSDIIGRRVEHVVKISGYGNVGDYVPFYYSPLSVMLYNILTGYGVPRVAPEHIVCMVTSVDALAGCGNRCFFTDGQANTLITDHYTDLKDLAQVDWTVVRSGDFTKSNADPDRLRRYQAEFLVHSHVPVNCIEAIVVYNESCSTFVRTELDKAGLIIPVHVSKKHYFNR